MMMSRCFPKHGVVQRFARALRDRKVDRNTIVLQLVVEVIFTHLPISSLQNMTDEAFEVLKS